MFSLRTDHPRSANDVSRAIDAARAAGRVRWDLTVTNPTELGLGLDVDTLRAPWTSAPVDRYVPDPRGDAYARRRIGAAFGMDPEHLLLSASTSEAYAWAFAVLADPGDRVLVPSPSYPLLEWLARLSGVSLVPYELRYDGRWYVDLDSVDRSLDERTRAIVCVSPNNPTGSFVSLAEREALLDRGLPLVVDEVFARFPLDDDAKPDLPRASRGLVLRLSGLSKFAAAPQVKLGFVGVEGADDLVDEALARLELVADTFLSVSAAAMLGAPSWIDASAAVRERIVRRCRANLAAIDARIAGTPISRYHASAGWSVILRVPATRSEDAWVEELLARGVVVMPGWFFDLASGAHVVLSLLPAETDFAAAIDVLVDAIERATNADAR